MDSLLIFLVISIKFTDDVPGTILRAENIRREELAPVFKERVVS